jgi:translation initiation factor 1
MLDLIGRNSPEHQALNKLKLDEFKLNAGIKNDSGTVNQAALNKIIYHMRKHFNCSGSITNDPEFGEVICLTGDQKENVFNFLVDEQIYKKEKIIIKGI